MKVATKGITEKLAELRGMSERLKDLTPAMEAGAQAIVKHVSDRFRSATDPEGAAWKPLAASTVARRRKRSDRILQDTGILKNSITATSNAKSITFGTNVPYAGPHQFGTRKMPRRAFLPVGLDGKSFPDVGPAKALVDRIARYIRAYVMTGKVTG